MRMPRNIRVALPDCRIQIGLGRHRMSRGCTLPVVIVMIGLFWGSNDVVVAQSDAEKAMQSARGGIGSELFHRV